MIVSVETAIVLLVPEADALLDQVRGAPRGDAMPAHITLLYPFAPDPDAGVLAELAFFFSGVDGFPLTFGSVGEFPEVVYLAPDQDRECQELTAALARRWPEFPPYGGAFDANVPHLTVAKGTGTQAARAAAEAALPLRARASEASLWARESGTWRCVETFPLAPPEPEH